MGENDIVFLMAQDLAEMCELTIVDTAIYAEHPSGWYEQDYQFDRAHPVRWLDHDRVLSVAYDQEADFVIVNAGGMSLRPETIEALHKKNVVCIGISLSDPDTFPYHGRVYSRLYDSYYTNSIHSLKCQYDERTNIKLLPFAASARLHRPLANIEKKYDIVVVGHARPERLETVSVLKRHFSVGLFGSKWAAGSVQANGEAHVKAINSGKMYLSFSKTSAGFVNVKVGIFEAAACRTLLITQLFDEMENYFKYGMDVVGYAETSGLVEIVDFYLRNEPLREWIAENSYKRFLKEHTWKKRWESVVSDIANALQLKKVQYETTNAEPGKLGRSVEIGF
jgi:spore maturation protein CgeB